MTTITLLSANNHRDVKSPESAITMFLQRRDGLEMTKI